VVVRELIIDADSHITEPPDVWTSRVPSKYHDDVPQVVRQGTADTWVLKGQRLAPVGVTAPGSSTDQLVKYILRQHNLDPQSIPVVTGGIATMLAALEQDCVWAGVTVDPLTSRLDREGIAKVLYDTRTEKGTLDIFGGPWPAGGFYTTAEFIQEHPRVVQSMVNAGIRALRYLKEHSAEEVAAAMPESFWAGDRNQYIASLRSNVGMYSPDGLMPPDGPPNVLKTLSLVDEKVAGAKLNLQETYDNTFALKVR